MTVCEEGDLEKETPQEPVRNFKDTELLKREHCWKYQKIFLTRLKVTDQDSV